MRTSKTTDFLVALLFLVPIGFSGVAAALKKPSQTKVVLTSRYNGLESDPSFDCSGKVHAYVTMPEPQVGPHQLEGRWVMPNGEVKDVVHKSLEFKAPGQQVMYVWFDFGGGGALSGVRDGDENPQALDGLWQLQFKWDGQQVAASNFQVKCL